MASSDLETKLNDLAAASERLARLVASSTFIADEWPGRVDVIRANLDKLAGQIQAVIKPQQAEGAGESPGPT